MLVVARDLQLARRANRAGARHSLRIVWEARRAGLPLSLALALVEQESAFRNVVGHDPGGPHPGAAVTRQVVKDILASPVSNGVGLTQLTYKPYIRKADRLGGAHRPKYQLRVGFQALADNVHRAGSLRAGIKAYNGTGPAADNYARRLLHRQKKWHQVLNP